jgi:hypothetical protein
MDGVGTLRDELDRAREAAIEYGRWPNRDVVKHLDYAKRSYRAWQRLQTAVRAKAEPTFLPHRIADGAEWLVQVLWPDGYEEHIGSFRGSAEAEAWIGTEALDWVRRR